MKTIFDFSPTENELKALGINDSSEKYKAFMGRDPENHDSVFADLYRLFAFRGDEKTADEFIKQIKNEEYRFCTGYSDIVE